MRKYIGWIAGLCFMAGLASAQSIIFDWRSQQFRLNDAHTFTNENTDWSYMIGQTGTWDSAGTAMQDLIDDLTPQLGGTLDTVNNWLSGDGDNEGIQVEDDGDVLLSNNLNLPDGGAIGIAANELLTFNAAGNITLSGADLLFSADNAWDIGAAGATRPKDIHLSGDVYLGDDLRVADGGVIGIPGNEILTFAAAGSITLSGANLLFNADNAWDIGAVGATRPKDIHLSGDIYLGDDLQVADGGVVGIPANEMLTFNAAGNITLSGADLLFSADNAWDIGAAGATRPKDIHLSGDVYLGDDLRVVDGGVIGISGNEILTFAAAGSITLSGGDFLFNADNAWDIGASGATRPKDIFVANDVVAGGDGTFSGEVTGLANVDSHTDATVTLTALQCRGALHVNDDADVIDFTLPAAVVGMVVSFKNDNDAGAVVITVDVNGTDIIVLNNGTALDAGDAIDSSGALDDKGTLVCYKSGTWVIFSEQNVWVDGGAD